MKSFHFALLCFVLAACSTSAMPTQTLQPTAIETTTQSIEPSQTPWPVVTLPSGALEGSYTTVINIEELRTAGISEHELCENAGTFTLTLVEGQWTMHQDTAPNCTTPLVPDGAGEFTLEANQLEFYDEHSFGCELRFTYQANLINTGILFTLINDPDCPPRTLIFTSHPWLRE